MKTRGKLLSIILGLAMLLVSPIFSEIGRAVAEDEPATVDTDDGIELETEKIDPGSLYVPHLGQINEEQTAEPEPADPEKIVRVSIFLEGNATVDQGFDTKDLAHNTRAIA